MAAKPKIIEKTNSSQVLTTAKPGDGLKLAVLDLPPHESSAEASGEAAGAPTTELLSVEELTATTEVATATTFLEPSITLEVETTAPVVEVAPLVLETVSLEVSPIVLETTLAVASPEPVEPVSVAAAPVVNAALSPQKKPAKSSTPKSSSASAPATAVASVAVASSASHLIAPFPANSADEAPRPVPRGAPKSSARKSKAQNDRWDWVIASLCISAGVVGLRVVNDPVLWSELVRGNSGNQPIGTLVKKKGGVRMRSVESPLWHDVSVGSRDVSAGDTVFTGDDGQAELVLFDGGVAEIQPNSLIVVQRSADVIPEESNWGSALGKFFVPTQPKSVLKIERGGAKVALKKDSSPIKLQVKNKIYKLSSDGAAADAEVSVDGKGGVATGTKIASLSSGALNLSETTATGEGSTLFVGQGQQAILGAGKGAVQKIAFSLVAPTAGEQLLLEPSVPVVFQWKAEGNAGATQGQVEIEGPDSKVVPFTGPTDLIREALKPGSYRWRVVSEGTESAWRGFNLVSLAPPQPEGPVTGAWIDLPKGKTTTSVQFSWTTLPEGLRAQMEWSAKMQEGDTQPPVAKVISAEAAGTQVTLPAGQYQWRVRAKAVDKEQFSAWSNSMELRVRAESEISAADAREASAVMAPVAVPPPAPVAVVPPAPAPMPAVLTPPAPPVAKLKAPVKAIVKEEPKKVELPKPKPVRVLAITRAQASTRLGKLERLDEVAIPLTWSSIEDVKHYDVVVREDGTRKLVLNKRTPTPSMEFVLRSIDTTRFTYQVTAVMDDGEKVVSAPVLIEVALTAPILKTPANNSTTTPNRQGTILITWERTVLTESYVVQLCRDKAFPQNRVREEYAPRNLLSVRGLAVGVPYYWRVQSVSNGHHSEWSAPSLFTLTPPSLEGGAAGAVSPPAAVAVPAGE